MKKMEEAAGVKVKKENTFPPFYLTNVQQKLEILRSTAVLNIREILDNYACTLG